MNRKTIMGLLKGSKITKWKPGFHLNRQTEIKSDFQDVTTITKNTKFCYKGTLLRLKL